MSHERNAFVLVLQLKLLINNGKNKVFSLHLGLWIKLWSLKLGSARSLTVPSWVLLGLCCGFVAP